MWLGYPAPLQAGSRIGVGGSVARGAGRSARSLELRRGSDAARRLRRGARLMPERRGLGQRSSPRVCRRAERDADRSWHCRRGAALGGELAVELLPHLDWDALRAAEPTWLVGRLAPADRCRGFRHWRSSQQDQCQDEEDGPDHREEDRYRLEEQQAAALVKQRGRAAGDTVVAG